MSQTSQTAERIRRGLALAVILAAFSGLFALPRPDPLATGFEIREPAAIGRAPQSPVITSGFVTENTTAYAHSAAVVELPDGRLRAFWAGGSREGAQDVAIYSALYDPAANAWGVPIAVADRHQTQSQLQRYIKKLGNPVATVDRHGRIWLFYVSVSAGGWSGSAINVITSDDGGRSWGTARRLVTSPFLNVSTLVKSPPVFFRDGSMGLPVYHEFLGKFGELLRIDDSGRLLRKQRLSRGRHSLQPVIIPVSGNEAVGFLRYSGEAPKRILRLSTGDGGRSWSRPLKTELPNPNAAIKSILIQDDDMLLAFNNSDAGREDLSLAYSGDSGGNWRVISRVELATRIDPLRRARLSYPWMLRTRSGDYHLFYSWHGGAIKHVSFNEAWLAGELR